MGLPFMDFANCRVVFYSTEKLGAHLGHHRTAIPARLMLTLMTAVLLA